MLMVRQGVELYRKGERVVNVVNNSKKSIVQIVSGNRQDQITANKMSESSTTEKSNLEKFVKSKNAAFFLKSTINNSAFWVDTNKWSFKKTNSDDAKEFSFQLKRKSLYAFAITEEIEFPLEYLAEIAITNAKNAAPNTKIIKKEEREINDLKIVHLEMSGILNGVNFTYLGYYFSDSSGSTQLVVFSENKQLNKYKNEAYEFLNGLTSQ